MVYFLVVVVLNECLYMYCIIEEGSVNLKLNLPSQLGRATKTRWGGGGGQLDKFSPGLKLYRGYNKSV